MNWYALIIALSGLALFIGGLANPEVHRIWILDLWGLGGIVTGLVILFLKK